MIGDTIVVTYNAVNKTLVKVNQDSFGSEYYLDDSSNLMRFTLTVNHQFPKKGKTGPESHLMKLSIDFINSTTPSIIDRTTNTWAVLRTDGGLQDFTASKRSMAALLTAATVANTDKMLGRES